MAVEGMSFQAALRDLDGQQYLFQIRITPYNFTPRHRTFTVSAISDDICSSNSVRGRLREWECSNLATLIKGTLMGICNLSQQMSGLFMLKYTLHPHHKRNKLQLLLA
ncbi:hypothetical protein HID58_047725 [Brassica napus]|uniref:Uncharacterized protein n=1 Tax=Brassica napus TaxID=3708 RepID=A0ABQ8B046_BRANA|nr:hypothetical protein HID58_047725 [Brassica napus]